MFFFQNLFPQGFEVKPMKLYFDNENYSQNLSIKNLSNIKTSFSVFMQDYIKDAKGSLILLKSDSIKNSCSNFITFFPSMIDVDSMSEAVIQVKFDRNIKDANVKWGMLIIKPVLKNDSSLNTNNNITIKPQIGVKVYCNNKLIKNPRFKISELKKNNEKFFVEIESENEYFFRLNMLMLATNIETLKETKINEFSTEFIPNSKRIVEFSLPKNLEKGKYSIAFVIKDENLNFIAGKELIFEN
jgi:hypothetical protein